MYKQIKKLADDALALQNKDRMDAALREISAMCSNDNGSSESDSSENLVQGDIGYGDKSALMKSIDPAKKGGAK